MKSSTTSRHGFALFTLLCFLLELSPVDLVTAQSGGNLDLQRNVIAGGGNTSTGGGNLQISGTVGQAAAGTQTTGGPITQLGGFWPAILGMTSVSPPVPGAGILQFSSATYNTLEDCAGIVITVARSNGSTGTVTVNYATSDGNARQRSDYEARLGTLTFAEGVTSRTFNVLTNRDAYVEGQETINLTLSNPTGGAALGNQSTTVVIIADNVSMPPSSQPIDDAATFVCQHYHDFLNRQPDASGLDFWTNEITSCGTDQACIELKRINVSASFYLSIEFQETGFLVERLYKAAYGSTNGISTLGGTHQLAVPVVRFSEFLADTQQIGQDVVVRQPGWEIALENSKQAFVADFMQRSRFTTAFPTSMTPAQFVDTLNANCGNLLSTAARNQLVNDLANNARTRAQVLRAMAEDPNLVSAESNSAFVLMQYFVYLRRNPNDPQDNDYTGYDFWLTKLNQFHGNFVNAEMIKAFLTSIEYRTRFAP
jgi:hypothetical protein